MGRHGAASRPSALVIWAIAAVGLFMPLVFTVLELSSRYPDQAASASGASTRSVRLPVLTAGHTGRPIFYAFPGILYFAASVLFVSGGSSVALDQQHGLNRRVRDRIGSRRRDERRRLDIAKWLSNVGGMAAWIPALLLIALGLVTWAGYGSTIRCRPLVRSEHWSQRHRVLVEHRVRLWRHRGRVHDGRGSRTRDESFRGPPRRPIITVMYGRDAVRACFDPQDQVSAQESCDRSGDDSA